MLKFLRKYSKAIMVVFGSILMVIFLLPSSLQGLGNDAANMPVGKAGDRKIHMDDLREADAMMKLLTEIGLPVRMPGLFPYRLDERNDTLHWVLQVIEAERQGIYVSRGEATALRKSLTSGERMPPEQLQKILLRNKVKEAFLDKAIQQMQTIRQLQIKLITFRYPSTPLLQHTALDHLMKLELELVPIKAEEAVKDIKEPTEEELKAQYEKFKTELPGTSKPHGFGYRLPTRVKMEYLSIPRSRVIASITIDEVEAMEYYVKNPSEFLPPPELPPLPPIVPDIKGPLPAPDPAKPGNPGIPTTPGTPTQPGTPVPAPTTPAPTTPAPTTPGTPVPPAAPTTPAPPAAPAVPAPAKPSGSSLLNASGDLAASAPCVEEVPADSSSLLITAFQATNPAPPATTPAPAAPAAPATTPAAPATGTQPAATPPATPATPATPAAPAVPAATTPAKPAEPKPDPSKPEAFEKVKARIINKLAEKKADEKIHEILRWAMADLNTQAIRIKKNELSYFVIDNPSGLHDLQKLQADIQAQFKLLPDYVRPADKWLSMADLGSMAGIGKSTIRTSATGAAIAAVDYIGSAKELLTELPEEKINRARQKELAGTYKLQLHAAGQPMKDADGNVYIFRLVAGEPTRQPNNLDEVRAEVVKDVKSLKAFEALKARGDALAADARKEGMEKFAKAHTSTLERTVEFSRRVEKRSIRFNPMTNRLEPTMKLQTPDLPHVGVSEQFLDQVFNMASAIVAAGGMDKAPPEKLVGFITVETGLKACVVKVTKITQVDTDQYKEKLASLQQYIAEGDVKSRKSNPLSLKTLKKQLDFKTDESAGGSEADKKEDEEQEPPVIQQEEPDFELPF